MVEELKGVLGCELRGEGDLELGISGRVGRLKVVRGVGEMGRIMGGGLGDVWVVGVLEMFGFGIVGFGVDVMGVVWRVWVGWKFEGEVIGWEGLRGGEEGSVCGGRRERYKWGWL